MTSNLSEHDVLQDLLLLENSRIDQNQRHLVDRLRRHVRELWQHVQRLEKAVSVSNDELVLRTASASLVMKKDGTIVINGHDVTIEGSGRVAVKAGGPLSLKGQKIEQN